MQKQFSIVVAINNDALIGVKEYNVHNLPWPMIKEDVNFFRKITATTKFDHQSNAIIMGWNTWISTPVIYKKNKKRLNIVIARDPCVQTSLYDELYVETFDAAVEIANKLNNIDEIFVIGGAVIYDLALRHRLIDKLYITHVNHSYPTNIGNVTKIYFPLNQQHLQQLIEKKCLSVTYQSDIIHEVGKNILYQFKTYQTVSPKGQGLTNNNFVSEYQKLQLVPRIEIIGDSIDITTEEHQYLRLVENIMQNGIIKKCRNGYTKSIFGAQLRYNLADGYPLSTIKKSYPKAIFEELMWMIRGETNVKKLQEKGVHIWDKNSSQEFLNKNNLNLKEGDIGPGYGFQMRYFGATYKDCLTNYRGQGIDQLQQIIDKINSSTEANSRRIIIDLWNPLDVDKMALPPCHINYHFVVDLYDDMNNINDINDINDINNENNQNKKTRGRLNCHLFQRSWDVLLGWNTTTAALFTYLLANHCHLDPGMLVHSITDAHLYQEHIDNGAIVELLKRKPRTMPKLTITKRHQRIEDYQFEDLVIENYYPCPPIVAEMIA